MTAPAPLPAKRKSKRPREPQAIPVAAFHRLVREITQDVKPDLRWEAKALEALQVDAEAYLQEMFRKSDGVRKLCESKTLEAKHVRHFLTD